MTMAEGVVAVSGAASGIGRSIALGLARVGWRVMAADRSEEGLVDLEGAAREERLRLSAAAVDVRSWEDVKGFFAGISDDELVGVVHCAGVTARGPILGMERATYDWLVETDLGGSFVWLTEGARVLVRRGAGGSVVAITSINGLRPLHDQALYSALKGAVNLLVSSLAVEVGPSGVRVNAIAPGAILTPMNPGIAENPSVAETVPLRRIGLPEDLVGPVKFLLSDESAYVTGSVMVVDGGLVHVRGLERFSKASRDAGHDVAGQGGGESVLSASSRPRTMGGAT